MLQIDHYKELLLAELAKLKEELAAYGKIVGDNESDWVTTIDPADPAEEDETIEGDRMQMIEIKIAALTELEGQHKKVLDSLARIENGTFGKCSVCGKAIEAKRLAVNPTSTKCMAHM